MTGKGGGRIRAGGFSFAGAPPAARTEQPDEQLPTSTAIPAQAAPAAGESGLLVVRLEQLAANPRNQRSQLGDLEDLADIAEIQLQPALAVTRAAYLAVRPDDADRIGDAKYVVIAGNRRLAAAGQYGRADLEIVVKDEVADSDVLLKASGLKENIKRRNLDPFDEARGIVDVWKDLGENGKKAAEILGISTASVSNAKNLLNLVPDLREQYRKREINREQARKLWSLPADEQPVIWRNMQREQAENMVRGYRQQQAAAKAEQEERDRRNADETADRTGFEATADLPQPREVQVESVRKALDKLKAKHRPEPDVLAEAVSAVLGEDGMKILVERWLEQHGS